MTEHGTETATGTEQEPKITTEQAAAEKPATETATDAGEQQTEEQKAAAEEARKAEEIRKSKEGTPDPVQKKIDKEVGRRKAAEAEAARAREEAAYLRGKLEAGRPEAAARSEEFQPTRPKPVETDYDSTADFVEAVADWKIEQREAKAAQENAKKSETGRVADIIKSGMTKYEDFEEKVLQNPNLPITREMKAAIDSSEAAHDILHHLGSNPQEADRISKLTPFRQAVEIGKIEAKLTAAPAPPAQKKPAPPAPPATLDKGTGTGGFDIKRITIKDQAAMMGLKDEE